MQGIELVHAFDDGEFDIQVCEESEDRVDRDTLNLLIEALDGNTNNKPWNGIPLPEYITDRFIHENYCYLKSRHNEFVAGGHPTSGRTVVTMNDFVADFFGESKGFDDDFDSVF